MKHRGRVDNPHGPDFIRTLEIIFCAFWAENYFIKVFIPFIGVSNGNFLLAQQLHQHIHARCSTQKHKGDYQGINNE